jgi:CheY-like chemotaxis protein/DNA-binding MarR family transcriptional regulator
MIHADARSALPREYLPVERSGVRAFDQAAAREGILVLDDDPASLRLMQEVLWTAGYECIATHLPEEAIAIVAGPRAIKVVISDICMPDIDGLMFLDRLNLLRIKQLPQVLFLTGHPTLDRAVAAMRLGATDFLVKPVRPRELLDAVQRACFRASQTAPAAAENNWTVESLANQAEALAMRLRMMTAPSAANSELDSVTAPVLPALPAIPAVPAVPATAVSAGKDVAVDEAQRQLRTAQLLDTMEQLRRLRRRNYSGLEDMDDVAWELLMEVLRSGREGRQISVSGLTISVEGVSPTTALRRTNELVAKGYLHRIPDPTDARRDFVTLDAKTRAALEDYLSRAAEHLG